MNKICPSNYQLESHFYAGLKPELKTHLSSCPDCQAKIQDMDASRKAFLIQHPYSQMEALINEKMNQRSIWAKIGAWIGSWANTPLQAGLVTASLAALILFAVYQGNIPSNIDSTYDVLQSKGGPSLEIYTTKNDTPVLLKNKSKLSAHQPLQITYTIPSEWKSAYGVFLGVEENNKVTVYHPTNSDQSVALELGSQKALPTAISWEPSSANERFLGVFSQTPFSIEEVKKSLQNPKELPYAVSSVVIYRAQ